MVPQGGHIAWDHEDDPSDEVRQAEEGVLALSTKKLIIFRSIYAKTSPACLPVGRAVPRAAGGDATPHTQADAPLLRRRRVVPPSRQGVGRVAGAEEHHKARAAPQHCGRLLPLPTTHLLSCRREEEGHEGKGREPAPRPS